MIEYNGVNITLIELTGEFRATVSGVLLKAPSLAALKKKIDATEQFVPFEALVYNGRHGLHRDYDVHKVVGRKYIRGAWWWELDRGSATTVYPNDPENLRALKALDLLRENHRIETNEMYARHEHEMKEALAKISKLPADKKT